MELSMSRAIEVVVAIALLVLTMGSDRAARAEPMAVAALLAAAHGAPPLICAFAARAVDNGWGNWADAPSTPLMAFDVERNRDERRTEFSPADEDRLLAGLTVDDPCVRELAVRLLVGQRNDRVAGALVSRLESTDASLRALAAFGLGLVEPPSAVNPLIKALGDATPGVRANSAWALGHIEDGRALAPLVQRFRDDDVKVREAAVAAVGRLDSTSAVGALTRVVQQDASPDVRRVAAWALGNLESRESASALATVLGHDSDA